MTQEQRIIALAEAVGLDIKNININLATLNNNAGGGNPPVLTAINVVSLIRNHGVYEHTETIVATGVVPTDIIQVWVAPHGDTDENCAEMLDVVSLSAKAGTDEITISAVFLCLTVGIVRLYYKVN